MSTPQLKVNIAANTDKFKSDMNATSEVAHSAVRRITAGVIEMNAGWLATQGAVGGTTLAVGRFLPVINQVLLAYTAIKGTFELMSYAIDLANKKIADWNTLAAQANASGFSTDFFQRVTKSSGEARDKIDDVTAALKKFNDASTPKLGGSDLQQRLDSLTEAGNFKGNTGVAALGASNDSEGRLRAIVSLIDQAMQKGERLAALDLAGAVFGPSVQSALQKDNGYLDDMLKRADALNAAKIVSPEDVGRAVELKERMDAAQQTLANKWKPIQDDLAKLGMNYEASWVGITEDLAAAVGYATQLYTALKQVPDWFAKKIGGASIWDSIVQATTTPESRAASEASLGISSDPKEVGMVTANAKLTAALQNHANVTQAMQTATDVSYAVQKDTSKNTGGKDHTNANDPVDSAINTLTRHTEQTEADTKAVGQGASALARLRAEAQETAAVQANGGKETDAQADAFQDLQDKAAAAADALAKAKVASQISRGSQSAFLTPEDLQIANQLAGIYGDNIPAALASSEAAALRFNNALKQIGSLGQDVTRGVFVDFETQIRNGASAMDALKTAGVNALGKIADKLSSMAADQLWKSAFGGATGGLGSFFSGIFGAATGAVNANGSIAGAIGPTSVGGAPLVVSAMGNVFPANDNGISRYSNQIVTAPTFFKFATGAGLMGEAGPEAIMPLKRGPDGRLGVVGAGANDNGSVTVHAGDTNINIQGDASEATLAAMKAELAKRDAQLPGRVVAAVKDAKARRVLA